VDGGGSRGRRKALFGRRTDTQTSISFFFFLSSYCYILVLFFFSFMGLLVLLENRRMTSLANA